MKVADPPIFHGEKDKDTVGFEAWIRQALNKLAVNGDLFANDRASQSWLEARLGGAAAENLLPYLRESSALQITTTEKLLEHLEQEYRNPNQKRQARDDYEALKMKAGQDYRQFKNDFVRLAGECGEPRANWKDQLKRRLTPKLQTSLASAYIEDAVHFEKFSRTAAEVANSLDLEYKDKKPAGTRSEKTFDTASRNRRQRNVTPAFGTEGNTARRMSPSSLRRAYDQGRCFKYNEAGHMMKDCPKGRPAKERSAEESAAREARFAAVQAKYGVLSSESRATDEGSEN